MDLLDSIMNGMEKPPQIKKPVIKDDKKRAEFEKMIKDREELATKQRKMLDEFRSRFETRLHQFINTSINEEDEKTVKLCSKPLDKIFRTIVHEICDDHEDEVVSFSFGVEDVDRHCVIWKRGYEPCEAEIMAMKAGVEYKKGKISDDDDNDDLNCVRDKRKQPSDKQIAEGSLRVESAQRVMPGKQYGFVPLALKEDKRSVEQVIDDQRKLKKQRIEADECSSSTNIEIKEADPAARSKNFDQISDKDDSSKITSSSGSSCNEVNVNED